MSFWNENGRVLYYVYRARRLDIEWRSSHELGHVSTKVPRTAAKVPFLTQVFGTSRCQSRSDYDYEED